MAQQQEKRRPNVGQQGQQTPRGKDRQGGPGGPGQSGQRGQHGQPSGQERGGDNPRNREDDDVELEDEEE